jgi:hypothetical protein
MLRNTPADCSLIPSVIIVGYFWLAACTSLFPNPFPRKSSRTMKSRIQIAVRVPLPTLICTGIVANCPAISVPLVTTHSGISSILVFGFSR